MFSPLTRDDVREIAAGYLSGLQQTMAKAGKTLDVDDEALEMIASAGYSAAFGARFLKRTIDDQIKLPITTQWNDDSRFRVRVAQGTIAVEIASARLAAA